MQQNPALFLSLYYHKTGKKSSLVSLPARLYAVYMEVVLCQMSFQS